MARLPVLTYRQVDRLLRQLGFEAARQRGSHVFYRHPDGRTTTVPNHKGRDLAPPLLRSILHDIRVSSDELVELLRS